MKRIYLCISILLLSTISAWSFVYKENKLNLMRDYVKNYKNYAEQGLYENEPWVNEYYPADRYYDLFGNHVINGYYIYSIDRTMNTEGTGGSTIYMNELYKKWFGGLIVVGDILDDRGVLAMVGDQVNSFFTPFTFNQTLFNGVRLDLYFNMNYLSILTSRISNPGRSTILLPEYPYGMVDETADWLTALHFRKIFENETQIGLSYLNIHHEEGSQYSNPFSGVDSDSTTLATPTALSVYGIEYAFKYFDIDLTGEYVRSQEFLDGDTKATAGNTFTVNASKDFTENFALGGEFYSIDPVFKTAFHCPAHPYGDGNAVAAFTGDYLYNLVEDNDDKDDYPENGKSRLSAYPTGDPDGVRPDVFDRNRDSIWDYTQDFLSYEVDDPKTTLYFDRNNNLIPDNVEDDAYPDYPYVPSFYLVGENYYRYNDSTENMAVNTSTDSISTHKGLIGINAYFTFHLKEKIYLTAGILQDKSIEDSYQSVFVTQTSYQTRLQKEEARTIYAILNYEKEFGRMGNLQFKDMAMKINDNIPNHTVNYYYSSLLGETTYYIIQDDLPLRNSFINRSMIEYELSQNRGLNFVSRINLELGHHTEEIEYLYPQRTTQYLTILNKAKYIYPAPWDFLQGLFIIPQYKHVYENASNSTNSDYSNISSPLDTFYTKETFTNYLNLVNEYKITPKTRLIVAYGLKRFDDAKNSSENYFERNFTNQLLINDHYRGLNIFMTIGYINYQYKFDTTNITHNTSNNPHNVTDDISLNEFFVKIHCGF